MSIGEIIQARRSVRAYSDRVVGDDMLMTVLEAGRLAPSACNIQPWYFVVIRDDATKLRLKQVYDRPWFLSAPVIIAVCVDRQRAWVRKDGKQYGDVDAAIAMDHMILAATELGLGTCWIGAFDVAAARNALRLPSNIEPVVFTPLGFPADEPRQKSREQLQSIVRWESF